MDEDANDEAEGDELASRYLWGAAVDQLFAQEDVDSVTADGDLLWALTDNLNSVRDLVEYDDATDQTDVVLHRTLSAFGEITSETGAADTQFGFTGRIFEEYTSLQNNWRRWYDPRNNFPLNQRIQSTCSRKCEFLWFWGID